MKSITQVCLILLAIIAVLSCKKNEEDTQIEIISGNITYNSIIASEGDNYFVLDQNKIRLLNIANPENLSITSTFPLTEIDFESIRGNKDTLFIQTAEGIRIYTLSSGETIDWQEVGVIEDVLPCDKFDVKYPYMMTSVRNSLCNFSENNTTELRLYDITKLDSVFLKSTVSTPEVLKVQKSANSGFYTLSADGKLTFHESAGEQASFQIVIEVAGANDFNIYNNTLIISSNNNISQYRLTSAINAQLLSAIPVSQ